MLYEIFTKGDMNDGDYTSSSTVVDLDSKLFEGCSDEFENITTTYREFLQAFSQAIKTCKFSNYANFLQEDQDKIFEVVRDLLKLDKDIISIDLLQECSYDFLPMSADYPIHTVISIVAVPVNNIIKFF